MSVVTQKSTADKQMLRAVTLLACSKLVGDKEKDELRDMLTDGTEREIELSVVATIDGQDYREDFEGRMSIGFGSTRAGKVDEAELIAWILSHVPAEVRSAVLDDALATFTANDCSLPVEKAQYERVKAALSKMRAQNQTTTRGAVSVKLNKQQPFAVVG